jgi:hypothetical protein
MTKRRVSQSEVIGFDESEGCLRVRLRTGSIRILDENGQPVVVNDPLIRKHLLFEYSNAPQSLLILRTCGIHGDKGRDSENRKPRDFAPSDYQIIKRAG